MIPFTDMTGLASSAIAMTAACLLLPGVSRWSRARLGGLLAVVFVVALIPLGELTGGLPLAAYVRGAVGDLSIATLLLLAASIRRAVSGRPSLDDKSRLMCLALIAVAALLLYPMALGWGAIDPYRLGYGDPRFLGGLFALTLFAVYRKQTAIAVAVALAVLAWGAGWYESTNLWDYLLDPMVSIYAIAALIRRGARQLPGRKTETLQPRAE